VKCLDVLAGTIRFCSGERTLLSSTSVTSRKLPFRFVTSIVLGISYGRRISDLKDEMVSFNYNTSLGKSMRPSLIPNRMTQVALLRVPAVRSASRTI